MQKSILELLANSFDAEAWMVDDGKILLPKRILEVMGTSLKGDCCHFGSPKYLLVSKMEDVYFKGKPLRLRGRFLLLPKVTCTHLRFEDSNNLRCHYNGVGDYFTLQRNFL